MTTITTRRLTVLTLATAALTTATLTAAEARGFARVARVASHAAPIARLAAHAAAPRVAARFAFIRGTGVPRIPVTTSCAFSNCNPTTPGNRPPGQGDLGGEQGKTGAGGGNAGGTDGVKCQSDRDCGIFTN